METRARQYPADGLKYTIVPELPISARAEEILTLWRQHQVVVIGGATGSGKTTQLPKLALELGRGRAGRIGCTQPRRLAATAMARRVSQELNVVCGEEVGYQVRFDDHTSANTVIKFMTDGILLAETAHDRNLKQYDTLIIDEAHERSLNIDFLLGYLKHLLSVRRDLKVAISSATMDLERFSEFFNQAPVIEVEGRMYPVEDVYLPPETADEELEDHVARAVAFLSDLDPRGDILIFLPGEREIRDCGEVLEKKGYRYTEILPLYACLSGAEQQKVFQPGRSLRRIILSTNVAETSVTIPGIRFCIDSGLARVSRYNPRSRIQELQIESISQASVRQRRGRCGRTADGVCVHLYSEDDFTRWEEFTDPEIKRTSLAGVILNMAVLHLPRIDRFPFPEAPPSALIREGMRTLEDLLAVQPGSGRVTKSGWKLAALPLDPHLGKMLEKGEEFKVLAEMLVIVSFLSLQDPRERPLEKQQQADDAHRKYRNEDSDFIAILNLWGAIGQGAGAKASHGALRRFARNNFLNYNRVREWLNLADDLRDSCREFGWRVPDTLPETFENTPYDALHQAILSGIPRQIGKFDPEYRHYAGANGRKYSIFPGSGLFKRKQSPPWMMSFAVVETSRLYGRQNALIKPEYLERVAPHLCTATYETPYWDEESGFVYAKQKLSCGSLVIQSGRRVHYGRVDPVRAREIFIREGLVTGKVSLPGSWVERHVALLRGLENLELKLRRPGTVVDYEAIYEHFHEFLPADCFSTENLKRLIAKDKTDYSMNRADMMQEQYQAFREEDYPDELVLAGSRFRLVYRFDPGEEQDGIFLVVPHDKMELLPGWTLDYPVPGYLAEKVEYLLKALPKEIRKSIAPLGECARDFAEALHGKKIFAEQPLTDALAEFLSERNQVEVAIRDFESARFPAWLNLRIWELNEAGQIAVTHSSMPVAAGIDSRIHRRIPAGKGANLWECHGRREWPDDCGKFPETVELPGASGKVAYPALVDEDTSIGRQLFLHAGEAALRHRAGVVRLFRLRHADQVKFIKRTFRLDRSMLLAWFTADREQRYAEDLADATILEGLGCDVMEIRDGAGFIRAEAHASENLGVASDRKLEQLRQLLIQYEKLHDLTNRLKSRRDVDSTDLREQVKFLFAPGFLRRPAVWSDYPRYLRGAQVRAERMNSNPAKDEEKMEALSYYAERFAVAAGQVADIAASPELYEFWRLLEECRIAVFAPELPLRLRNPLKQLDSAWNNLHF